MATENPGAVSGKDGDAYRDGIQICELVSWNFKGSIAVHSYSSNCSGGYKKMVSGIRSGQGSLKCLHNPGRPAYGQSAGQMMEGDNAALGLYMTDTHYITMTALITSVSFEVDVDEGNFIDSSFDFEANGPWNAFFVEESSMSSSSSSSSSGSSSSSS